MPFFCHIRSRPVRAEILLINRTARSLSLLGFCLAGIGWIAGCGQVIEDLIGNGEPQPAGINLLPARGPVLGGTRVTITGTNAAAFESGTDVLFGSFLGADIEIMDERTLRVTAPAQAAGRVDVVVRLNDGSMLTRTEGFEYVSIEDANGELLEQIEQMFPGAPHVVSAIATSNTTVRVTFSEPVQRDATDASNYSIIIPEGGILLLDEAGGLELSADHTVVDLPTLSQADAFYRLTVSGIHDLAGHPIAPPDMLVNPTEASFFGIAPAAEHEHIDTDGDGLADWFEMLGWPVTIELANGQQVQAYVTSDPYNPDTDGDGLTDGEENARSMDPRTDDTDADLVLDREEVFDWRSDPCDQDSDDDGFADQTEIHFQTSLILADTDGDQLSDRDELLNRSRNPRIADLPVPVITVGEMSLDLDERYTYSDQFGREQQVQESYSDTLQRDTSSSYSRTNSTVTRWHVEAKVGAETGVEAGKGDLGPIFKWHVKVFGEASGGFAREYTHATTSQSSQHTSRTYNEAISRVSQLSSTSGITRETVGARLAGAVSVGAGSDIAFQLADLELSVLQQDPADRSRLVPIATLVPSEEDTVYHVGPLAPEIGPLIFQNTEIFPSMVEELMKDPRGLLFQVANFNITDELGRNFAFTGQEIVERTARITIDFGNGQSESYRIATAGRFDPDRGVPLGISMAEALQAIELLPWPGEDPELGNVDDPDDARPKPTDEDVLSTFGMRTRTAEDGSDVRVITRVRGVQDDYDRETVEPDKPNDGGFWVTFATLRNNGDSTLDRPVFRGTVNFDEVRLHAGESYILAFVKDKDRDMLTSLEEFFSGSSDALGDTDRDHLGDFLEVRGQWDDDGLGAWLIYTDRLPGGYRTYSAPYLADSDEDGLTDDVEYAMCRYRYEEDGSVPAGAFATETIDNGLATWDVDPADLPDAFPPADGLGRDWHTQLDPETGVPLQFPSNRASLDPRKADTDEDGISDADEVNGYYVELFDDNPIDKISKRIFVYSDPRNADTDSDGLLDGMERQFGTNPVSTDSDTVFDDDLDGLPNRVEEAGWEVTIKGMPRHVYSDPQDPDSDNDNLPDYVEWVLGTSPWYDCAPDDDVCAAIQPDPDLVAPGYDTDDDGLSDFGEWDGNVPPQDLEELAFCDSIPNCAGYPTAAQPHATDPVDADTDDDGLADGDEITGWIVYLAGSPVSEQVYSDPLDPDSDNDGWPDGGEWRGRDGLPPSDPNDTQDATNPMNADTDDDGTSDFAELSRTVFSGESRDPLTPDQRITVRFMVMHVVDDSVEDFMDGYYGAGYFDFQFRVWPSPVDTPIEVVSSDDLVGTLELCPAGYLLNVPSPCNDLNCGTGPDLSIRENTVWVLPGSLTTYSRIMPYGQYFSLDGWVRVTGECPSALGAPDWDFSWYFASTTPYSIPCEFQPFNFTTGATVDDYNEPVELTIQGQVIAD